VDCEGTKGLEASSSVASSMNADRGIHTYILAEMSALAPT